MKSKNGMDKKDQHVCVVQRRAARGAADQCSRGMWRQVLEGTRGNNGPRQDDCRQSHSESEMSGHNFEHTGESK